MPKIFNAHTRIFMVGLALSLSLLGANYAATNSESTQAPMTAAKAVKWECNHLITRAFPPSIVDEVLTKNGISVTDAVEIQKKLAASHLMIQQKFADAIKDSEPPEGAQLHEFYKAKMHEIRLGVFQDVMQSYVKDPAMVAKMFDEIGQERQVQVDACIKEKMAK